ncbi:pentatricopeptide repeat-containing protein At5g44230-like [Triticum dicoccoides]|uniref:pentatricopeptide repeat-containing protein At5g44230-like n=1 Tax=Triticum dicoccoides TaxID=85692 RepID=UPI000E79C995|nr:pentatricopeptide repeat-containing protein At5g44230-like [Triticum dicoccoides]
MVHLARPRPPPALLPRASRPPLSAALPLPLLPPPSLASLLLAAVDSSPSLRHLRSLHGLLVRLPLPAHSLPYLLSRLLRRFAALPPPHAPLPYALSVFSAHAPPDPFLAAALLRFALLTQPPLIPFRLFSRLLRIPRDGLPFLPFAFSPLAKSAAAARSLPAVQAAHAASILLGGFDKHRFVENSLIGAYVTCGDIGAARKVFDEMVVKDVISWTSIVVAYSKSGDMGSAEEMFAQCPVKDMVAWTAMLTGYAQNSMPAKALEVFDRMATIGMGIDEVSLTGAISACAQLGAVRRAAWVQEIAERNGFGQNVVVGSGLVDMHAKCGLIDEARSVFDGMQEKNVYTYSSMIVGLASHGRAKEAIALFKDMVRRADVVPNHVTFIGLLTACSHAGMVRDGRFYFAQMKDKYGILPSADHYTCMVDLLGRAGLVDEALDLVRSMTVEPHGGVWGALLGACRIHGNTDVAKVAAEHLFKLEPEGIGNYVLLSNTLASAGKWDEVSKVRKLMRSRGLKKDPAVSSFEGRDGLVHQFFAGDNSHPRTNEIKKALLELAAKLKHAGYVPILTSIVYDVSDGEKERLLMGHSEKLALSFGLLTLGSRCTIRIVKNLRICEDCHLFMQLASRVEQAEIIVRDNMRFHHFKDGECSCGGFW